MVDEAVVKNLLRQDGRPPALNLTAKISSSIVRDTSQVPPPRSKMRTLRSPIPLFSRPYATAAAVDSLMIRRTLIPGMVAASNVSQRLKLK